MARTWHASAAAAKQQVHLRPYRVRARRAVPTASQRDKVRSAMRTVSAALVFCACTLIAACSSGSASSSAPPSATPGYTYARHYVNGQVTSYIYTEHQAGTTAQLTAAAKLASYVRGGVGGEQVKWVSLTDAGHNLDAQAQAFPPYDLSLDPRAANALPLPKPGVSGVLRGPVDELRTFFADLSAKAGVTGLHQPGDSHVDAKLIGGNFSTATAPVEAGNDLIQLTTTLTALTSARATFTSSYRPPRQGGLKPYRPWMSSPVCSGVPNNFQLVELEGSRYIALWGCESFTVTTKVDRASGQIISVQLTNSLQLKGRQCQDKGLTRCTTVPDTQQERVVTLTRSS